jgi:hypothetical protein
MNLVIVIAMLLIVCIPTFIIYSIKSQNKKIAKNKLLIEDAYKAHSTDGVFDASTAIIVRDRYEIGRDGWVQLDRICRSNDGKYFLFLCTWGEKGYFTHLSNDRAKNALRSTPEILHKEFPNAH